MGPVEEGLARCSYSLCADQARTEDSGEWRCQLTNSLGTTSAICTVKVLGQGQAGDTGVEVAPAFEERLDNVVVDEDETAIFRCRTFANSRQDIKWFCNDIPIAQGDIGLERYSISTKDGVVYTLEITGTRQVDAGVYKCKASNSAGWASCDAKLYIKATVDEEVVHPVSKVEKYTLSDQIKGLQIGTDDIHNEADTLLNQFCDTYTIRKFLIKWGIDDDQTLGFPVHLKSKCAVEGTSVSMTCLGTGEAPLQIRWYKDHKEIFDGAKYFVKNQRGILCCEIPCVRRSDTGRYMCEVKNIHGKIYSSCYLQVEPVLEITNDVPIKPMFLKPMKRLTVNEGELIRFRVTVKAFPPPGFKWFKDGIELQDSTRITMEVLPKGVAQLVVANATVRDIGLYTCEAHNQAGRAKSMVRISVRDKFEAELWKERCLSLNGMDVSTDSTHSSLTTGDVNGGGPVVVGYAPKYESEEFAKEPIFNVRLPKAITIPGRGRFIIECCCSASPRPKVTWYKNDEIVKVGSHYNLLCLGDWYGLEVVEALPSDAGTYMVKIVTGTAEVTSSCTVNINLPTEHARHLQTAVETVETISESSPNQVTVETQLEGKSFGIADIIPSFHLCNTEADWSTLIDKEVEVISAVESPSFTCTLPERVAPRENDTNIRLECKVGGHPCPKVIWFKDGHQLEDGDNISWSWDAESRIAFVLIRIATHDAAGKYSCVAYSEFGGHAVSASDVYIRGTDAVDSDVKPVAPFGELSIPRFTTRLTAQNVLVGSDVTLDCRVEGVPAPVVSWYRNDDLIASDDKKYTIKSKEDGTQSLTVTDIEDSDCMAYRCEAVNEYGMVSTRADVHIVEEHCNLREGVHPTFAVVPHNITAQLGQDAILKCEAMGSPAPQYSWKKDGTIIETSDKHTVVSNENGTTLTVKNITKEDIGVYFCIAQNKVGEIKACSSLKIKTTNDVKNGPNSAANSLSNVIEDISGNEIIDNSSLTVLTEEVCEEIVTPRAKQTKEGGAIVSAKKQNAAESKDTKTESQPNKTENRSTEKEVSLSSSNKVAKEQSTTEKITEDMKVIDTNKKGPRIVQQPFSQWAFANGPLRITVKVLKSDNLGVQWFHNEKVVNDERFKTEVKES